VAEEGKERRRLKRHDVRVRVRFETGSVRGQGRVRNIHKEGMFVASHLLPSPLEPLRIVIEWGGGKIEVRGTVRWTSAQFPERGPTSGFGVQLDRPGPEYFEFFSSLLLGVATARSRPG
jgi:hypothetical protein